VDFEMLSPLLAEPRGWFVSLL